MIVPQTSCKEKAISIGKSFRKAYLEYLNRCALSANVISEEEYEKMNLRIERETR